MKLISGIAPHEEVVVGANLGIEGGLASVGEVAMIRRAVRKSDTTLQGGKELIAYRHICPDVIARVVLAEDLEDEVAKVGANIDAAIDGVVEFLLFLHYRV